MKTREELLEEYEQATGVRRAKLAIELRNQGVDPENPRASSRPPVPPRPVTTANRTLPPIPTSQGVNTSEDSSVHVPTVSERKQALQAAQQQPTVQRDTSVTSRTAGGVIAANTQRAAAATRSVASAENTYQSVKTASAAATTITVNDKGIMARVRRALRLGGTHEEQDTTAQVILAAINDMIRTNKSAHSHSIAAHDQTEWNLVRQYIEPLRQQIDAPDEVFMQTLKQLANAVVARRESKTRSVTFRPIQQDAVEGSSRNSTSLSTSGTGSSVDSNENTESARKRWGVRLRKGFSKETVQ